MSVPNFIRAGSPVPDYPGGTHNWLVARVSELLAQRGAAGVPLEGTAGNTVRVKNGHTAAVNNMFGVLKIDGPLNDPGTHSNEPYQGIRLVGTEPEVDEPFAILQRSAAVDQVVDAVVSGPTWVQLDIQDEADKVCGPIDGDTAKLESGTGSTPIIWKESGTGIKWAIVLLGGGAPSKSARALEPAYPGQEFRYSVAEDPNEDLTTAPTATNGTGRFLAYGAQVTIKGSVAEISDTATTIRLTATQDNPTTLAHFETTGYDSLFDNGDVGIKTTWGWFNLRYIKDDPSTITEDVNKFELEIENLLGDLSKVKDTNVVDFAVYGNADGATGAGPRDGVLWLTPLGLGVAGDGGGITDLCSLDERTGEPTYVLGYDTACGDPGMYPPVKGEDGVDGQDGINGTNGTNGINGINGTNGTDGIDGDPGPPGVPPGMIFEVIIPRLP